MKRLVVLAAFLTVCSACKSSLPLKVESFKCRAPKGMGLQAAFDQFRKYYQQDLPLMTDSYALFKILGPHVLKIHDALLNDPEIVGDLHDFLCERGFVDGRQYAKILANTLMNMTLSTIQNPLPKLKESQYKEDVTRYIYKIWNSWRYGRSMEILGDYEKTDRYVQLGSRNLRSAEFRKLVKDAMATHPFVEFFEALEKYEINPGSVLYTFVHFALSSWVYK